MGIGGTKAVIALGSVTAMAFFYDEAIGVAQELIYKTKAAVVSAELCQFDKRLLARWDTHGGPPRTYLVSFARTSTPVAGRTLWSMSGKTPISSSPIRTGTC